MIKDGVDAPQAAQAWTIRRGTPNDLDEIVTLWFQGQIHAQEDASSLSTDDVKDFYLPFLASNSERFGLWIAESLGGSARETILGWQSLLPCRSHPIFRSHWAESSTYVRQTIRVKGVGRALITHVTENAAHTGLTHIVGYVREGNIAMMKIVEGVGWKKIGTISCGASLETDRHYYVFTVSDAAVRSSLADQTQRNA